MDRVYESGASATPPTAPATPSSGHPGNGNKTTGTMPTTPGAYWFYQIMEELMAVINAAAITPNHLSLTQLKQALDALYLSRTNAGLIKQPFSGLLRQMTPAGGAQVREYADQIAATTGNIEIGMSFNCAVSAGGVWAGRDIADICWLEKWSNTGGVKEFWVAPTAAAGVVPAWTLVFAIDLVNGILSVPTMAAGNNTQAAASTAFVTSALAAKAPLASPAFTGAPTAPTQAAGNNTTRLATTAFVQANSGVGVGQTWQDVTASRAPGVNYTNTSSRPIQLCVGVSSPTWGLGTTAHVVIGGVNVCTLYGGGATVTLSGQIIVPPGETYGVVIPAQTSTPSISSWFELR